MENKYLIIFKYFKSENQKLIRPRNINFVNILFHFPAKIRHVIETHCTDAHTAQLVGSRSLDRPASDAVCTDALHIHAVRKRGSDSQKRYLL